MARVEIELTTLVGFLRKVCHVVFIRFAVDNITRICGKDGVLIIVFQRKVRQWFAMGIFRGLHGMDCNKI